MLRAWLSANGPKIRSASRKPRRQARYLTLPTLVSSMGRRGYRAAGAERLVQFQTHHVATRAGPAHILEACPLEKVGEAHEPVARRVRIHRVGLDHLRAAPVREFNGGGQ